MKEKTKQLQTFILSLMMLIMGAAGAWGDTTETNTGGSSMTSVTGVTCKSGGEGNAFSVSGNSVKGAKWGTGTYDITVNAGYSVSSITIAGYRNGNSNNTWSIKKGETTLYSENLPTKVSEGTQTCVSYTYSSGLSAGDILTVNIEKESLIYVSVTYTTSGGSTCATPEISCSNTGAVSISCDTDGASIRYTTDDSNPTSSTGTLYESAFNITSTTTVKAIAYKDGYSDSDVASQSFTIYSVTYNGNENTGGDAPSTAYYKSGANVTVAGEGTLVKSGNTFNGWNTQANGSGTPYSAGGTISSISANTELFAQWTPAAAPTYSVTYHNNLAGASGSVTDGSTYEAGASVKTQANSFSKSGYTFLGWSTSSGYQSSYTTAGNNVTMVAGGLDLYAQWQIDGSILSSPATGSSVVSGQTVTTTATSTAATGMKYNQGSSAYTVAQLIAGGGSVSSKTLNWTLSQNAIGAHVFSAVLTDGTFYSAVLTQNYTIGAAAPVISCSGNMVTITSDTNLAEIHYTTDGTEPTNESALYSAPFPIGGTTTVKAIAIKSGSTSATTTKVCESGAAVTTLPVTFDFTTSPWSTSTDFSGAVDDSTPLTILDSSNNHNISFYGNKAGEFSIKEGSPNYLQMTQNGSTNHFIAIPMSGINGRIDIEIWAPYAQSSNFTIRAVLDTNHGTTVQSAAPSAIKTAALDVNDYKDGHFYFRMKDLTATEGVLYIGPASSSYKDFQKIRVTSPAHYLIPDKASVFMGDGSEPETVTITNYSSYPVLLKTVPSCVTATFEPSTGVLVVTPKSIGTGNIEFAVDTNGDGEASDVDLSIPVTVTGITNVTAPTSAVYDTSSGSYSPALDALSVTATKSATGNTGTLAYQWYSNTVNSNTGGTVISGATSNTLSTDKISTTDSEKAAFYYCVVSLPGDSCKSVASDVAYVLTSKSKRYFHMSNVAGNRQTSDASEKITGEIVAGGTATAIHGADSYYRYITRPSSSYAHMYVVSNANNYIKINLKNAIATDDVISVLQMGNQGTGAGIKIATDANGSNAINIYQDGTDTKTYSATFTAAFNGVKEIYILGKYEGHQNYFTDLYISKPAPLAVSAPTPASQTVQSGETPAAFTVTATGGTGSYTYEWKQDTDPSGSFNDDAEGTVVSDGGTSTFTPTSKSVTSNTNYYYKCIVTSGSSDETTGAATLTVTTLTHGYMTIDGTAHAGQTYSFDNNEFKYFVNQSNYNSQNVTITDGQNQKFWELDSSPKWATKDPYTNAADIKAGSNAKFVNLYIKDAVAFKVLALNSASRTYDIYVDGKKVATSQSANPSIESPIFALNKGGSKIEFNNAKEGNNDSEVQIAYIIFYKKAPATINIMKNGEEVTADTKYMGDGATEYEVETNGDGNLSLVKPTGATDVDNGYRTTYVEVTLKNGILSVTPLAATPTNPSTPEVITINHTGTSYADASTTLNVTVKKHTLALAFSYDKASFKASTLTSSSVIPSGSLPTLKAYKDGVEVTGAAFTALGIRYMSDDITIGSFASNASYAITYGGGQGGARIYAYVDNRTNQNVSSAKAYFDLVVEAGTSNALPSTAKSGSGEDKEIYEQKQFRLANSQGVEVVRLTYGGYKYAKEGKWKDAEKKGEYYIDGYPYYTRHDLDAFDEYGYQLRGMSDEPTDAASSAKSQYTLSTWSSQNVNNHKFWYASGEGGTTGTYQRIHPFTLPTRGGYLKFEPKQTGKLTVYVWQNGVYSGEKLGSKPRLGYWFDQDGWVQHPTVVPVTKQPLSKNMGSNTINLTNLDNWKKAWKDNGDEDIKPLLTNKWCSIEKPNWQNALTATYRNDDTQPTGYYENPFYWMTEGEIGTNLNEEETIISKKMTPVPFHNGYMVPEASYLKYVLNVVAGKTYYFYGMMTKIGYVGMNFVQDEVVDADDDYTSVAETLDVDHQSSRHLNAADNMSWVSDLSHDYTVYDEVTLPSNYKKGQWSTICLPFALSESQVEEAFGKGTQLTIYNGARKKGTGVYSVRYLSHVDRNILAGQPYFIKPSGVDAEGNYLDNVGGVIGSAVDGAGGTRITFNTIVVDKAHFSTSTNYGSNEDVNASGTDIDQYGYEFVGSTNNDKLPTYSYIVSGGKLRQFTGSNTKIPTYYAYLKPHTTEAQSGSFSLQVDFNEENVENAWVADSEDDPTGVISMEAIADAMNNGKVLSGKAYNMMGQEVDPTSAKGIVIIDGKKYMFK